MSLPIPTWTVLTGFAIIGIFSGIGNQIGNYLFNEYIKKHGLEKLRKLKKKVWDLKEVLNMVVTYEVKEGTEQNTQEAPAFTRKYLDEEREEEGERITLRINKKEREQIDFLKDTLNYSSDSTVIKLGVGVFENVIRNTLSIEVMKKVSSQVRRKPIK